jgi:hypothetical protein
MKKTKTTVTTEDLRKVNENLQKILKELGTASKTAEETGKPVKINLSIDEYRLLNGAKPHRDLGGHFLPPSPAMKQAREKIEKLALDWPAVKAYPPEKTPNPPIFNDYRGQSLQDDFVKLQKENENLKTQVLALKNDGPFVRIKKWVVKWFNIIFEDNFVIMGPKDKKNYE